MLGWGVATFDALYMLQNLARTRTTGADGSFNFSRLSDPKLDQLIDLGYFSPIAKILVAFLLKVHGVIGNWGVAIMILTITARTLLFPLTLLYLLLYAAAIHLRRKVRA